MCFHMWFFMTFFMTLTHQNEEYELVCNLYSTTFFSEEYGAICYNMSVSVDKNTVRV